MSNTQARAASIDNTSITSTPKLPRHSPFPPVLLHLIHTSLSSAATSLGSPHTPWSSVHRPPGSSPKARENEPAPRQASSRRYKTSRVRRLDHGLFSHSPNLEFPEHCFACVNHHNTLQLPHTRRFSHFGFRYPLLPSIIPASCSTI